MCFLNSFSFISFLNIEIDEILSGCFHRSSGCWNGTSSKGHGYKCLVLIMSDIFVLVCLMWMKIRHYSLQQLKKIATTCVSSFVAFHHRKCWELLAEHRIPVWGIPRILPLVASGTAQRPWAIASTLYTQRAVNISPGLIRLKTSRLGTANSNNSANE